MQVCHVFVLRGQHVGLQQSLQPATEQASSQSQSWTSRFWFWFSRSDSQVFCLLQMLCADAAQAENLRLLVQNFIVVFPHQLSVGINTLQRWQVWPSRPPYITTRCSMGLPGHHRSHTHISPLTPFLTSS